MAVHYQHTGSALSQLQTLLRCSLCDNIADSPCNLGSCEHIYCRVCCEAVLGKGCPVCCMPADVRDAQVNRQLFNLVTLCRRLDQVLSGQSETDDQPEELQGTDEDLAYLTPKHHTELREKAKNDLTGNDLMTSHEGDNVSYALRTPTRRGTTPSGRATNTPGSLGTRSTPSKPVDKPCTKSTPTPKKAVSHNLFSPKLGNRNSVPANQSTMTQHFGYTSEDEMIDAEEIEKNDADQTAYSTSSVQEGARTFGSSVRKVNSASRTLRTHSRSLSTGVESSASKSKHTVSAKLVSVTNKSTPKPQNASKRLERRNSFPVKNVRNLRVRTPAGKPAIDTNQTEKEDTEKQKKVEDTKEEARPNKGRNKRHSVGVVTARSKNLSPAVSISETRKSVTATNRNLSPALSMSERKKSRRTSSPRILASPLSLTSPSAGGRSRSKVTVAGLNTSLTGSGKKAVNELEKRNAKGETSLQVACIKGDLEKVVELLQGGATPNTRDNAGWTPLHEACHHGYVEIACVLLDHGALIDVPGTDNATPLHDAVNQGRIGCVALLVSRGASLMARNLYGYTPGDYVKSEEMKFALKTPVKSVAVVSQTVDVLEYQLPCFLGTGLNRDQRILLQKCATLLNAKIVEDFCPDVTHVITSSNHDGQCPCTIKYLRGVLTGKWIVNDDWVSTCLEYGSRVSEEAFEVPGSSTNSNTQAAQRGRTNSRQQLPGLFDGCQFYFHGSFDYPTPEKSDLVDLVKCGGGLVIKREPKVSTMDESTLTVAYHADPDSGHGQCCVFVVHDPSVNFSKIVTRRMCSVPASWIMDCVASFKLLDIP